MTPTIKAFDFSSEIPFTMAELEEMEKSQDRRLIDLFPLSPDVRANPVWGTPRETGKKHGTTSDSIRVTLMGYYRDAACGAGFSVTVHNREPQIAHEASLHVLPVIDTEGDLV